MSTEQREKHEPEENFPTQRKRFITELVSNSGKKRYENFPEVNHIFPGLLNSTN